jgi:hypothetical protein
MGLKNELSIAEKTTIEVLHAENYSARAIAIRLGNGRSHSTVSYHLNLLQRDRPVRICKKRKLSARDDSLIGRSASNEVTSAKKIKATLGLDVSESTVLRSLRRGDHILYAKKRKTFKISPANKIKRLQFCHIHEAWQQQWKNVLFSDEKKFNLDGPDGWQYYWHDLRKEPLIRDTSQAGTAGIMVWAGFGTLGKTELVFCSSKMKSADYITLLDNHLIPYLPLCVEPEPIFQQDNAPMHKSKATMAFLVDREVTVMDWPPNSPDLNPQEEVWSTMARHVYSGGRTFTSIGALKLAIQAAWTDLSLEYLQILLNSMPNRMLEVIRNKGGRIHH